MLYLLYFLAVFLKYSYYAFEYFKHSWNGYVYDSLSHVLLYYLTFDQKCVSTLWVIWNSKY